ncbi:hypothetical protein L0938_05840 [Paracidovorax citrulli]
MTAVWVTVLAAARPIPFKSEDGGATASLAVPLLVALLLLGLAVAGLWLARQKGWLRRWSAAAPVVGVPVAGLEVEQVLRLSPRTRLYRVRDGQQRFVVLESTAHASVVALPPVDTAGGPYAA